MRILFLLLFLFFCGCQIQTLDDMRPAPTPAALAVKILPGAAVPGDCAFAAVLVSDEDTPHAATLDLQQQAAALGAQVLTLGDYHRVEGGAPLDPFAVTSTSLSGQAYRCGAARDLPPPPPPDPYSVGG